MTRRQLSLAYLEILEKALDPCALQLGIIFSEHFSEDVREQARQTTSLDDLRLLVREQRKRLIA